MSNNIVPLPSKVLSNLAIIHAQSKITAEPIARSIGFSESPAEHRSTPAGQGRDDRLALVEELVPGPRDYTAPVDDPHFERLEPNSGIYLATRKLAHSDLQEHLRGRYYLSPSLMYSVIRPLTSKQGYDVPVPGDWLTIAVIAERGPIKLTSTSNTLHQDDETMPSNSRYWQGKDKEKVDAKDKKVRGKKYMSLKLVDFGVRSHLPSASSKAQIRGDALLTLLLFEADSYSYVEDENRLKTSKAERMKIYKGGSGGAFEACMKLHEGAVLAILNPKILKPYQRKSIMPHPTNNLLAITPTSAQSIAIIGRSRDLGMCLATKRDGQICGSWCDKRVSDCCEYHVESAVQRKRAGRPEFSIGTSGMSMTAYTRTPVFDSERKRGRLPSSHGLPKSNTKDDGATYVIPGHVVSASGPEYVSEKIGRGREERARRRHEEKKTDELLERLLGRDGGGGDRNAAAGAVRKAREEMKSLKAKTATRTQAGDEGKEYRKSAYTAKAINKLGFDPTTKLGKMSYAGDVTLKRKLDALASLQTDRGDIVLGPYPGKRIRSAITVPDVSVVQDLHRGEVAMTKDVNILEESRILEDSEDELEVEAPRGMNVN